MSDEYKPIKRDAESLLRFSSDFVNLDDDDDSGNNRRDNRNGRDNQSRDRDRGYDNHNDRNNRNGYNGNNNGGNQNYNRDNNRNGNSQNGNNHGYNGNNPNGNQNNGGNRDNQQRNDQQRRNDQNYQNNSQQQNNQSQWDNPVCKIFRNDKVYDRDDIIDLLTKKDGLVGILKDLKAAHKDPSKQYKAAYVQRLLKDIVFASAIPDALEDLFGKKYDENNVFSRKEVGYFMNEVLIFLNNSYNKNFTSQYDDEAIESMRQCYTDILYRYNKKKVKKLCEEVKNMSKACAKQICIITAGNNPSSSVYQLIKYLYKESGGEDFFNTSVKSLLKLFKACFGKDEMNDTIKCVMLERMPDVANMDSSAQAISVNLDLMIREYLESCEKNEIHSIIKEYISERKRQDKGNGLIPRRFGDRRTIHPEDYPKLTKVLEDLEKKDFSIIQYLRK